MRPVLLSESASRPLAGLTCPGVGPRALHASVSLSPSPLDRWKWKGGRAGPGPLPRYLHLRGHGQTERLTV